MECKRKIEDQIWSVRGGGFQPELMKINVLSSKGGLVEKIWIRLNVNSNAFTRPSCIQPKHLITFSVQRQSVENEKGQLLKKRSVQRFAEYKAFLPSARLSWTIIHKVATMCTYVRVRGLLALPCLSSSIQHTHPYLATLALVMFALLKLQTFEVAGLLNWTVCTVKPHSCVLYGFSACAIWRAIWGLVWYVQQNVWSLVSNPASAAFSSWCVGVQPTHLWYKTTHNTHCSVWHAVWLWHTQNHTAYHNTSTLHPPLIHTKTTSDTYQNHLWYIPKPHTIQTAGCSVHCRHFS